MYTYGFIISIATSLVVGTLLFYSIKPNKNSRERSTEKIEETSAKQKDNKELHIFNKCEDSILESKGEVNTENSSDTNTIFLNRYKKMKYTEATKNYSEKAGTDSKENFSNKFEQSKNMRSSSTENSNASSNGNSNIFLDKTFANEITNNTTKKAQEDKETLPKKDEENLREITDDLEIIKDTNLFLTYHYRDFLKIFEKKEEEILEMNKNVIETINKAKNYINENKLLEIEEIKSEENIFNKIQEFQNLINKNVNFLENNNFKKDFLGSLYEKNNPLSESNIFIFSQKYFYNNEKKVKEGIEVYENFEKIKEIEEEILNDIENTNIEKKNWPIEIKYYNNINLLCNNISFYYMKYNFYLSMFNSIYKIVKFIEDYKIISKSYTKVKDFYDKLDANNPNREKILRILSEAYTNIKIAFETALVINEDPIIKQEEATNTIFNRIVLYNNEELTLIPHPDQTPLHLS